MQLSARIRVILPVSPKEGFAAVLGAAAMACLCLALFGCGGPEEDTNAAAERTSAQDEDTARALRKIATLGYVAEAGPATEVTGVVHHDADQAHAGFSFYNSAHDHSAYLIDMEGAVLHEWHSDFENMFGQFDEPPPTGHLSHTWRRAKLLEDGAILAIQENVGLVKLDRDSNVVWSLLNRAHHDADVDDEGRIYVLSNEAQHEPRFGDLNPVLLDYVRVYDSEGSWLDSISIDQAYKDSEFPVTNSPGQPKRDIYHTNTLQIMEGTWSSQNPAFQAGNLLLSFRCLDEIAILDPESRKIVWRLRGAWREQHEPLELANGYLLLFDNMGLGGKDGPARALEVDPVTEEVLWSYQGPESDPVQSYRAGSLQRLPNGNTLIVSSMQGRVIEVTPDRELAWEYLNPNRTGRKNDRRAGIFEFIRVDPSRVASWLELPSR